MRTLSTRPHTPISVIGNRSFAKPGSIPVVKQAFPLSAQARSSSVNNSGGHGFG